MSIKPGETVTVHIAQIVNEDELDKLYYTTSICGCENQFTDKLLESGFYDDRQKQKRSKIPMRLQRYVLTMKVTFIFCMKYQDVPSQVSLYQTEVVAPNAHENKSLAFRSLGFIFTKKLLLKRAATLIDMLPVFLPWVEKIS